MAVIDDISLKLDRAEEHLGALSNDVRDRVENSSPTIRTQANALDDSMSAIIDDVPEVRREWGVTLGDFLHNTRCALDHLVCALIGVSGGAVTNSHQFPICTTPQQWQQRVTNAQPARSRLGSIDPAHVAVIESVQPYQPGTGLASLATLQRFSNADKHRLIHAAVINTIRQPQLSGIWAVPLHITEILALDADQPLTNGTSLARIRTSVQLAPGPAGSVESPNADNRIAIKLNLTTAFGEPGNEDTRIKDFRQCLADVRSIVDRFAHVL